MKIPLFLILLFVLGLLIACSSNTTHHLTEIQLFEGTWQLKNSNTFEIWQKQNNNLSGRVIKLENTDTLLVEQLRIFRDKKDIYYEATVPSQNNGQPVRFKLTKQNNNKFEFENPDHDFPQKIVYTFENKNELRAIISGENKEATFTYQKIK